MRSPAGVNADVTVLERRFSWDDGVMLPHHAEITIVKMILSAAGPVGIIAYSVTTIQDYVGPVCFISSNRGAAGRIGA